METMSLPESRSALAAVKVVNTVVHCFESRDRDYSFFFPRTICEGESKKKKIHPVHQIRKRSKCQFLAL